MSVVAERRPFSLFERAGKREFDRAFAEGRRVAIAKDPQWASSHESFIGLGFTNELVADPYDDGPSRPGERWFFWVAVPGTETPTSQAEWRCRDGEVYFSFSCACGVDGDRFAVLGDAEVARDEHAELHES